MQWVLIVFTALPPSVEPAVTHIPVVSLERCEAAIERWTPSFEATEGLVFRFECRRVKTEGEEDGTVNE
ncbi:MAG: hypothetical protein KAJ55_13125 [Anaerolineales bacterium]|nr:hypothetical protein [Anaerolineales bacterium]